MYMYVCVYVPVEKILKCKVKSINCSQLVLFPTVVFLHTVLHYMYMYIAIPSSLPPTPPPSHPGGDHLRVLPVPPAAAAEEGGQGSHGHPASMADSQEALAQSL